MIFKRFYNEDLAQASFLVGCQYSKEAVVIDANRWIEDYLQAASDEGLRITAVTETHIHADYLSGSRELAQRTGASLYLSGEGDEDWHYAFASEPNVRLVKHGDSIQVGKVRLDVVHTPGHTPEHICFVLTDEATTSEPLGVFSGDFVFVGDVGRPDLLERAVNFKGTMEKSARTLYRSLQAFQDEPGHWMLWPGHGSGSACGKALGGVPFSTLAYERMANWALRGFSEEEFVAQVLEGQPEPPVYFKEMKRLNRDGPPLLNCASYPPRLSGEAIHRALAEQATVVDTRSYGEVATGHVPGTLNIPLDDSYLKWAGWLVPYDQPIYLIASSQEAAEEAARKLVLIGLDGVRGWLGKDGWRAYEIRHGTLPITPQVDMGRAFEEASSGRGLLLDVRSEMEWTEGHAPGAQHIALGYLPGRASEVPRDKPVYVHCGGGVRSAIATSVLHRAGFDNISNVPGGFYEYRELGLPIERGAGLQTA